MTELGRSELAEKILGYRCVNCRREFPPGRFRYQCRDCSHNLDVVYDYHRIKKYWSIDGMEENRDRSMWRYFPLLPVASMPRNHSIQVGGTPLIQYEDLAHEFELTHFCIKDDSRNPSGSLKDRATEIALQHASELQAEVLITASTGNAAASLSALAAFYSKRAVIVVPAGTPPAKLTQILQHGALLCRLNGTYDDAFNLALNIHAEYGWYLRSTGINPMMTEGKKTAALEIAEQLNWRSPDKIFVPVGDGCIIGGVYKGFLDLKELGWVDHIPQLIAVQAEGSAAMVNAIESGGDVVPVRSDTLADSISVDLPRDALKALQAVRASGGWGITVSDDNILDAQRTLSTRTGIFAEPAAAAAFAGFQKSAKAGKLDSGDTVVILISGSGLKDIPAAQGRITIPPAIDAEPASFRQFYGSIQKEQRQQGDGHRNV